MKEPDRDSLRISLEEGLITQEQYEALRERMRTEQARETVDRLSRRLLWAGLLLLGVLTVFFGVFYLDPWERIGLLVAGIALTVTLSAYLWRQPDRVEVSRGFLGLAMFEITVLLLLLRGATAMAANQMVAVLLPILAFGLVLGVYEDSTWLASPSAASVYLGVLWAGLPYSEGFFLALFLASTAVAFLVLLLLVAWHLGHLQGLREAYRQREASLGQLGRAHLVLYDLLLILVLSDLLPGRDLGSLVASTTRLTPFAIALAAVLYAWRTDNAKLLNVASLLLVAVGWASLWITRFTAWPLAVLLTAGVLLFLGLRGKLPRAEPPSH